MKKTVLLSLTASSLVSATCFSMEEKPAIHLFEKQESSLQERIELNEDIVQIVERSRLFLSELTHSNKSVMETFDLFSKTLIDAYRKEKSLTKEQVQEIFIALDFAADKHRFQTRKDLEKTPYITHPISVAHYLMQVGQVRDSSVIIGALLHDTVEETKTTFKEIQERFGQVVANYVQELTEDKTLSQEEKNRKQVINASHKSIGASQILMADSLYNVTDLLNNPPPYWSQIRIDRYFEWTQSVIDRLPEKKCPLYDAVTKAINNYWESQETQKKNR